MQLFSNIANKMSDWEMKKKSYVLKVQMLSCCNKSNVQ